ncbi:MAG: formate dehydrogenase accessory sulfurtransferase FdhD [Planctomycetes bacterium]|nr:formate dehydrogenase accessory sulfurtransferase FdhD [Planctomycetota bacterium]
MDQESEVKSAIREVEVLAVSTERARDAEQSREVAREGPLTIEVKDVGVFTIMCTPCDTIALAVGFAFSENLIERREDIHVLMKCPDDPNVIRMQLAKKKEAAGGERRLLIVTSCGMCGSEDLNKVIGNLPVVGDNIRISSEKLVELTERLQREQQIFQRTGGTHAAAIVRDGEILGMGEDLGRHSAFDKAVGKCLLNGIELTGMIGVMSGRVSFELAAKAARAGVELIAAVSAPSSLAIEVADRCNITLCGFVRRTEATVYTHRRRIVSG